MTVEKVCAGCGRVYETVSAPAGSQARIRGCCEDCNGNFFQVNPQKAPAKAKAYAAAVDTENEGSGSKSRK